VKRTLVILAGAAALGGAVFVNSRLTAQQPQAAAPQPLRTRVGLVNLPHIIKSYLKYQAFEREWQNEYQGFEKLYESKRNLLESMQKEMAKQPDQAGRDRIENQAKGIQREMQDMGESAKRTLSKKRDDQAVIIYKEIEAAVQAFARANDLELVMHYNEAITPADMYNPVNVQRKLQLGALFPMYTANGMDITQWIIQMLNTSYNQNANAPAPGGAPAQPRGN
jgi:Skp family chaperone for outer membrane proteins